MKKTISIILSLCLGLFAASGVVSVMDDSLRLFCGLPFLEVVSAILSFLAILAVLLVYVLMGITPMIPKRVFLPVAIFYVAGMLATLPLMIYSSGDWMRRGTQADLIVSLLQVLCSLGLLRWVWGGWKFRWPIVEDKWLGERRFTWLNLSVFVLVNALVLPVVMAVGLFWVSALAINHFTAGFVALHPGGLTVQTREYARGDGKKIELVPMAHVADAGFYRKLSASFPTNCIVLMEGVTDKKNLLTNGISYKRMARSLGLVEQKEDFKPRGELVRADIDVDQFGTNTLAMLNLVMLVHTKGLNAVTVLTLATYAPPPEVVAQLFDDLVNMRNQHLVEKIQAELPRSDTLIVPWGAGHMPGIASAIEKAGFHLVKTEDYTVIRFGGKGDHSTGAEQ